MKVKDIIKIVVAIIVTYYVCNLIFGIIMMQIIEHQMRH